MLLDEILYDKRLLALLCDLPKGTTYLQQAHYLADMISFIVVVSIFFCDYERKRLFYSLNTDPEIKERHIPIEEFFQALIHSIV